MVKKSSNKSLFDYAHRLFVKDNKIEKDNSNIEFYFYTNNITLSTYLSLDSISANSFIEAEHIEHTVNTIITDKGLLITAKELKNSGIIEEQKDKEFLYPVLIKLSFDTEVAKKVLVILIDKEYKATTQKLSCFNRKEHLAAVLFGHIPVSFINTIVFRTEDEKNRISHEISNIYYPEDLYEVSSKSFNGKLEIDIDNIRNIFKEYFIDNNKDCIERISKKIRDRNKLKGMLIGAFDGYRCDFGKMRLHFDGALLDFIKYAIKNREEVIEKRLGQEKKYIDQHDYALASQSILSNQDDTVFKNFKDILNLIFDQPLVETLKKIDSGLPEIDAYLKKEMSFFSIAIKNLIDKPYLGRHQIVDIIDELIEEIKKLNDNEKLQGIVFSYIGKLSYIKTNIVTDLIKINDYLSLKADKRDSRSSVLRAFMVFMKNAQHRSFDNLYNSINRFNLSIYERRLIWILFGALNGVSALGREMKKDSYLNRYADMVALKCLEDEYLLSSVNQLEVFKARRGYDGKVFLTDNGFPLIIELNIAKEEIKAEAIREFLYSMAVSKNKKKIKHYFDTVVNENPDFMQDYLLYQYDIPTSALERMKKSNNNQLIILKHRFESVVTKVTYILQFDKVLDGLLTNRNKFFIEYAKNTLLWDKLYKDLKG